VEGRGPDRSDFNKLLTFNEMYDLVVQDMDGVKESGQMTADEFRAKWRKNE
jgi:hypothetical protein